MSQSFPSSPVNMAYELHIPSCICTPAHPFHPPPLEKPLRIQIEGTLVAIEKLLPGISWHTDPLSLVFPQRAGPELARLAYRMLYGRHVRPELVNDLVARDEYLGWVTDVRPLKCVLFVSGCMFFTVLSQHWLTTNISLASLTTTASHSTTWFPPTTPIQTCYKSTSSS
jgi:hypothetical protein